MTTDQSQSNAIRHRDGPAMILAGPGSGKTTVITRRVEYMISQYHIDPSSILVITFSRAASGEMHERFLQLSGRRLLPVTFGTFHSIFFHILKCAYGFSARQIVTAEQQMRFVREYIRRLRLETDGIDDLVRGILSDISRVKNLLLHDELKDIVSGLSLLCDPEVFTIIYNAYGEFLRQNALIDFDDMIVMTKELFEKRHDILSGWQKRFRYILVDEFQDINPLQYDIIRMLALPENNLFIVGDDDQSIYRFRGSSPDIMLNFSNDYPETANILLDINYRSVPEIVELSANLISHNEKRFKKKIRAAAGNGYDPVIKFFPDQRGQDQYVIDTIRNLNERTGIPLHEIAVLYRNNAQPALLMHMMTQQNVPYISGDHIPCRFDHWIAQDLNAYLSLASGDRSRTSFLRIMNRPNRHLSRESLPYEQVSFNVWKQFYGAEDPVAGILNKFERDLTILAGLHPYAAVNYILKAMGYEDYLREYAYKNRIPLSDLTEVMNWIRDDSRDYDSVYEWFLHQKEFRREWEKMYSKENIPDSAVLFSTLHASKGLEFDTVLIVDVNEDVIPDKKAVTADDLEEERRLFYVGITRAKRRLYLLCSGKIRNKTMVPSRFLGECTIKSYPQ